MALTVSTATSASATEGSDIIFMDAAGTVVFQLVHGLRSPAQVHVACKASGAERPGKA